MPTVAESILQQREHRETKAIEKSTGTAREASEGLPI